MASQRSSAQHSLQLFRRLFEAMPDVAVRGSLMDGTLTYWNPAAERLYGHRAADVLGRSWLDIVAVPSGRAALALSLRQMAETRQPQPTIEIELRDKAGGAISVLCSHLLFDEPGLPLEVYALDVDISARKQVAARLELAGMVFEQSHEGIIITDAERNIVKVNPAFTAITGYDEAEVLGRNPRMLSAGQHDPGFYRQMWSSIDSVGSWQGEVWNRRKDGGVYAESLSIDRVCDADGTIRNYVSIISDVTERKRIDERYQRLAHHDPLTGLPNRAMLSERGGQALSLAQRTSAPVSLMFLDLDRFKVINDTFGHRIGDQLLIEVAHRLLSAVREHDTVSRQGGDEFVLVLPGTGADGAARVAEKVLGLIAAPMTIDGHSMTVTTSIGIALFPDDAGEFEALARAADIAMYRAKHEGRNGYRFYTSDMCLAERSPETHSI